MQNVLQAFLGVMFENENDANGMNNILHNLHKYVSFTGEGQHREYSSQPIVGDQLTVEGAVNGHMNLQNGFTPEERREKAFTSKLLIGMLETKP